MTARRFDAGALTDFAASVLRAMGCTDETARDVAEHLAESDLCGAPSHGIFRLTQYAEMAREGLFDPAGTPVETRAEGGGRGPARRPFA
ncbi:MAG: Ldh family oxidoreductase [Rhodospirillales bacterium]